MNFVKLDKEPCNPNSQFSYPLQFLCSISVFSDDLLDGEGLLGDAGDFDDELDGDAEDALLADDATYSEHYNLRTVSTLMQLHI